MSFSYFWPIILVVICNTFYQIFAKGIPADMDTMASMTVTYFVATITSACLFFIMKHGGSLAQEYSKMNYAPPLLGVAIVGLEVGFIYAYKIGWPVRAADRKFDPGCSPDFCGRAPLPRSHFGEESGGDPDLPGRAVFY